MLQGCPVNAPDWGDYVYGEIKGNEGLHPNVEIDETSGDPTWGPSGQRRPQ